MAAKLKAFLKDLQKFSRKFRAKVVFIISGFFMAFLVTSLGFDYSIKKDMNENLDRFMSESRQVNDDLIEEKLYDYLYGNLEKYLRSTSYSLFFEKSDSSNDFFSSVRISIIDSIRHSSYISDLFLYRVEDDAVVSAGNNSYSLERLTTGYNDIKSIVSMGSISKPFFYITAENTAIYVYPIINGNWVKDTAYRGFAGLYLADASSFFKSQVSHYNPSGTFIILCGNTVLSAEGANTLSDEILLDMLRSSPEDHVIKKKISSQRYSYYYKSSGGNNLVYLYYEPTPTSVYGLTSNSSYLVPYAFIMVTISLICILSYILLNHRRQMHRSKEQITAKYADELMKSNPPTGIELVIEHFSSQETPFRFFSVLIIEPDCAYLSELTDKQKTLLCETLRETSKILFRTLGLPHSVTLHKKDCVSCLINHDEKHGIKDLALQLFEEVQKYNKFLFNIYYTSPYPRVENVSEPYKRLAHLMKYAFIYNYSNRFSLEELEKLESNDCVIESRVIETVTGYLNDLCPDSQNLVHYLNRTLAQIRNCGYAYRQTIDFFNLVFYAIKEAFDEKALAFELGGVPLTGQLSRFKSLEECVCFIEACMLEYRERILANSTTIQRKNMNHILKFIEQNIENVTLSSAAEHFHITSAHLSRVFKDNVGINFSEYVSEQKLIRAAEWLKENTSLSIIDIASRLGYNTPSYFSAKFRERFGVTPGTYKKAILTNSRSGFHVEAK